MCFAYIFPVNVTFYSPNYNIRYIFQVCSANNKIIKINLISGLQSTRLMWISFQNLIFRKYPLNSVLQISK